MGYLMLYTACGACGATMLCNPDKVPSLRPGGEGEKLPLCRNCFERWNDIHRRQKGLEPVPLLDGAYEAAPETPSDRSDFYEEGK